MCNVAWCSFSWEAFATLATGLLAVGAAVWIGLKQMSITRRQVALENIKLRSELYDRRMEIYGATREWFDAFLQAGHTPDGDRRQRFVDAVYTSEFLFRPEVSQRLRAWYDLGVRHAMQERANQNEPALETAKQLIDASNTLHDLFGPDMRVGEPIE
tara:strand:- start:12376 stop:12846 length:471 start_codon:yes stop_codon:yes gene_type:complete